MAHDDIARVFEGSFKFYTSRDNKRGQLGGLCPCQLHIPTPFNLGPQAGCFQMPGR